MKKIVLSAMLVLFALTAFAGYIGSGGVRSVEPTEYANKMQWYRVTCNDGNSYKIGRFDDGVEWFGSSGYISVLRGLSINDAAEKACE